MGAVWHCCYCWQLRIGRLTICCRRRAKRTRLSNSVKAHMATSSLALLDQYIRALRLCLDAARDSDVRNNCFERLSSAGAMRAELEKGNTGAACAILSDEERAIAWGGFYWAGGESVHQAFRHFAEQVMSERLAGLPDAGFGH